MAEEKLGAGESTSEIKSKTISGFFWRFGERITAQLVTFAVTVVLARILMPEDYGMVAIVNVFIAVADVLVTSGLGTSLVQKKDADSLDFSTIFYATLFFAAILYAVLFFTAPFVSIIYKDDLLTPVLRVMGIRLFISGISSVQQAFVARKMIFRKFFLATLLGTVVSAAVGIVMALRGFGVWALVVQQLINPFIDTVVLFITVRWRPHIEFSLSRFTRLFSFGWKMTCTGLLGTVCDKIRAMLIGVKYSPSDLAFYNRGESLPVLVTSNITATLESVLFPAMSRFQDDRTQLKNAVRRAVSLGSYVLSPLLVGLAVVSDKAVYVIYGEKWSKAAPFVALLALSDLPAIISTINVQAIKACGRSDVLLVLEFIKKPLFLLMVFLTAFISPLAIAFGSVVYGLAASFINFVPNVRLLGYTVFEQVCDVGLNLLLAVVMAVPVYFVGRLPLNVFLVLLLQIVCGACAYVLESVVFRVDNFRFLGKLLLGKRAEEHS